MTRILILLGLATVLTACAQLAHARSDYYPTRVGTVYAFAGESNRYEARHVAFTCDDELECQGLVWGKPLECTSDMAVHHEGVNGGVPMVVTSCDGRALEFGGVL